MKLKSTAFRKYLTVITVIFFGAAILSQLQRSFSWGHNSWQITEWLINYSGGFVRRGLPGQAILDLSGIFNVPENYLAIGFSLLAFLCLVLFFVRNSNDRISLILMFSPILIGSAAYQDFIIRKDILGILFLIVCFYLDRNKISQPVKDVLINAVGALAILSHEAFFFFGFPALVAMRTLTSARGGTLSFRDALTAVATFSAMIAAFLGAVIFRGDASIATAINSSLNDLWRYIEPAKCCFEQPSAAIDALQFPPEQGLSLSYSVLTHFSMGIYVPLAWLISVIFCFVYLIGLLRPEKPSSDSNTTEHVACTTEKTQLALILAFQFVMIAPLWILGWDFGRWIFLWTTSSVAIYLIGINCEPILSSSRVKGFHRLVNSRFISRFPREWHLLFFGIPVCCWSVGHFLDSSPGGHILGQVIKFFVKHF